MKNGILKTVVALLLAASPLIAQGQTVVVTVQNPLQIARASETIELNGPELTKALAVDNPKRIHVRDNQSGAELLTQAVDFDGDAIMDQFIFQADLAPGETKTFTLSLGEPQYATREQFKAFGRFNRERWDDFAWENDRIAHRMYGPALETWQLEPLTSSGVDIWCKRTRKMVVNDWYMMDHYHIDTGEGADMYSVGKTRGIGGSGVWDAGKLFVSKNFMMSRVIAAGPIRVLFELVYAPWDVNGVRVAETKRICLDAGQNLDRFESLYLLGRSEGLTHAAGIKKAREALVRLDQTQGSLRTWERLPGAGGNIGCALVLPPGAAPEMVEADGNLLLLVKAQRGQPVIYYAGFGWDKSGDFTDMAAWDKYIAEFAERLKSPVQISMKAQ
jgi:pectinesterase